MHNLTARNEGATPVIDKGYTLPPGVAYLGDPSVSLAEVEAAPALALRDDGSLRWRRAASLGGRLTAGFVQRTYLPLATW